MNSDIAFAIIIYFGMVSILISGFIIRKEMKNLP